MTKEELFMNFKRNRHSKFKAIELLVGFLDIKRPIAKQIYEEEYTVWLEARKEKNEFKTR